MAPVVSILFLYRITYDMKTDEGRRRSRKEGGRTKKNRVLSSDKLRASIQFKLMSKS